MIFFLLPLNWIIFQGIISSGIEGIQGVVSHWKECKRERKRNRKGRKRTTGTESTLQKITGKKDNQSI